MTLERKIIKEIQYPSKLNWEIINKWADGIPTFSENDPRNPEWQETPMLPLDLSNQGYGTVYIKNEAYKTNPTQTIKDRAAWEITTLFRDFAKSLALKKRLGRINGNIQSISVPRLSLITAGNAGRAISNVFEKYSLPPIKLLISSSIPQERLEILKELYADIYSIDLSKISLTPTDIKKLTNNKEGIDITSIRIIEPNAVFYDWHVHEVFNQKPDEIYLPYGSGRLFENYLTWQERTIKNSIEGKTDPRLKVHAGKVICIDVFGVETQKQDSIADKITKYHNPFILFNGQDVNALKSLSFTGKNTNIYKVPEERILQAYEMLSYYVNTEPSACAGLALYLERFDQGKIDPKKKSVIINTGKGI